jgi:hypothetical protein
MTETSVAEVNGGDVDVDTLDDEQLFTLLKVTFLYRQK